MAYPSTSTDFSLHHLPNKFFLYSSQAPPLPATTRFRADPSALARGNAQDTTEKRGSNRFEAMSDMDGEWTKCTNDIWNTLLLPLRAKSWYIGSNVPGKRIGALNWSGGIPVHVERVSDGAMVILGLTEQQLTCILLAYDKGIETGLEVKAAA